MPESRLQRTRDAYERHPGAQLHEVVVGLDRRGELVYAFCRRCDKWLTLHELEASQAKAIGTHDRSGSFLCDTCWAEQCRDWCGPPGVEGEAGA